MDTHCSISLDITMASYWTSASARFSDAAFEEEKVDDFLDSVYRIFMLRKPHCPACNNFFGGRNDIDCCLDLVHRQAGLVGEGSWIFL